MELEFEVGTCIYVHMFDVSKAEGLKGFKEELDSKSRSLGYSNTMALWNHFVTSRHEHVKISRHIPYIEESSGVRKTRRSKTEPLHFTKRTIICPKLIPVGKGFIFRHEDNNLYKSGMYSARISLLMSNPCYYPTNEDSLFTSTDQSDQCDAFIIISNLQYIRDHQSEEREPMLFGIFRRAFDHMKTGTFVCP